MTDGQPYKCPECNKTLKNKQSLDYHTKNLVCQKLVCPLCRARFKSSLGLKYHITHKICVPEEKISLDIAVRTKYHFYTLERKNITNQQVMTQSKLLHPEKPLYELLFEDETQDMVLSYINLSLANHYGDQYWNCYIGNKREPFVTVYEGGSWTLKPRDKEFDDIIDWAIDNIGSYLKVNSQFMEGEGKKYWSQYLFHKDKIHNPKHRIRRDTRLAMQCIFINLKRDIQDKSKATGLKLRP